jgi:copper binding plastocyanin/azurin family protein
MHRFRQAAVFIVIIGLALLSAGCATAASAPSFTFAPPAAPSPTGQPTSTLAASPSASAGALSPSPASGATISLTEWKVTVDGTIKSGKTDLTITNTGVAPHELLVFKSDLDPSAYPTDAAGDIKEKGAGVTLVSDGDNIDPAGSQTRSIDLAPGKYLFVCNIPGHFKQGMFTVVTVAP